MALSWLLVLAGACSSPPPLQLTGGCEPPRPDWVEVPQELLSGRATFCPDDAFTGQLETGDYPAGTAQVELMMSGYLETDGMRLEVVYRRDDGEQVAPLVLSNIGESWQQVRIDIPARAARRGFKLRLVDDARGMYGWAGIGSVRPHALFASLPCAGVFLLVLLVCHAYLCALALGMPRTLAPASRLAAALLTLAAASYLLFLSYLPGPGLGGVCALLLLLGPFVYSGYLWRRRARALADLARFHSRLLPTLSLSIAVLFVGLFPFTWDGLEWFAPAARFRDMPGDNWLSLVFAKMLLRGTIEHPMEGDWLSSDRPPLQTGLFLIFQPLLRSQPGWVYQACTTWAQLLMLVPLSLLLPAAQGAPADDARMRPRYSVAAVMLLLLGLSPLLFLNGLFVWPKLFAGTFCILFHLLLFQPAPPSQQRRLDLWAGAAAGFVLLSHGGAICALFGSTLALLLMHRGRVWRRLLRMAPVTAALLVPWLLYQRLVDPPGDRLLKWHFAGQIDVSPEPFVQTFLHAYETLSFQGWLQYRAENVRTIFDGTLHFFGDLWLLLTSPTGRLARQTLHGMVDSGFFYPAYNAGCFGPLVLLLVLAVGVQKGRLRAAVWPPGLWLGTGLGLLVWTFAMFLPASTINHQGAYFTVASIPLLVMLACAQLSPRLFTSLAVLQLAVFCTLYVYDRPLELLRWPWVYMLGSPLLLWSYWAACRRAVAVELGQLGEAET
jgi:hypothetical protein